jgi:hypothetical protein
MNHLKTATMLANILDNQFSIAGFKVGLDPLLGLIPGLGDIVSAGLSIYMLWIAKQMGIPQTTISKMVRNIVIDFVLGVIPVVGDLTDFVYKANLKNLEILHAYAESGDARSSKTRRASSGSAFRFS